MVTENIEKVNKPFENLTLGCEQQKRKILKYILWKCFFNNLYFFS